MFVSCRTFTVDADLRVPESTNGFIRRVTRSPLGFVVLKECREYKKESHRGIDDALVGDVNVSQLLVHRLVQGDHRHHVDVRQEPERT